MLHPKKQKICRSTKMDFKTVLNCRQGNAHCKDKSGFKGRLRAQKGEIMILKITGVGYTQHCAGEVCLRDKDYALYIDTDCIACVEATDRVVEFTMGNGQRIKFSPEDAEHIIEAWLEGHKLPFNIRRIAKLNTTSWDISNEV